MFRLLSVGRSLRIPSITRSINSLSYVPRISSRAFASHHPTSSSKTYAQYLLDEGSKLLEYGQTESAMDAYMESVKAYPTSTAYYNIGNVYFQLGQIEDARENWLKSLDLDASSADVFVNLGNLELTFGKNAELAHGYYQKALELEPTDGEIRFNLGVALERLEKFDDAVKEYKAALDFLKTGDVKDEYTKEKIERIEVMIRNLMIKKAVVLATEILSYYLVYSKEDYCRLCTQVDRMTKMVEEKKKEPSTAKDIKNNKKLAKIEDQTKRLTQQMAGYNMRTAIANLVFVLLGYQFLNANYDGVVVAKLPFEPFSIFLNITHRGLDGDDYTEASAHLIFALGLALFRTNAQKVMEHFGLKPKAPKQMSMWEMATAEAEKLEKSVN